MATTTYSDRATIVNSSDFRDRTAQAVTKYALFIIGEDPGTQFHSHRVDWAQGAVQNPSGEAAKIYWFAVWDAFITALTSPVTSSPATIPDATLQTIVETAINNTILKF